jgi:hypothetical protein
MRTQHGKVIAIDKMTVPIDQPAQLTPLTSKWLIDFRKETRMDWVHRGQEACGGPRQCGQKSCPA